LHWQPRTGLNSGLRATIAYFNRLLDENAAGMQRHGTPVVEQPAQHVQRIIPIAEERRPATAREASPKLPKSLA
jgi:hypothetical protein